MIYHEKPNDFKEIFSVVSCFVENDGKFLLLHRQDHKPEGNTWGVPAGKIDEGESSYSAMVRELFEETGLSAKEEEINLSKKLYVRYDDYDFIYYIFSTKINEPKIVISDKEHKDFKWAKPEESLDMDLIQDMDECVRIHYGI